MNMRLPIKNKKTECSIGMLIVVSKTFIRIDTRKFMKILHKKIK